MPLACSRLGLTITRRCVSVVDLSRTFGLMPRQLADHGPRATKQQEPWAAMSLQVSLLSGAAVCIPVESHHTVGDLRRRPLRGLNFVPGAGRRSTWAAWSACWTPRACFRKVGWPAAWRVR